MDGGGSESESVGVRVRVRGTYWPAAALPKAWRLEGSNCFFGMARLSWIEGGKASFGN